MKIGDFIWQIIGAVIVFLFVGYLSSWAVGAGAGIGILIISLPWKKIFKKK